MKENSQIEKLSPVSKKDINESKKNDPDKTQDLSEELEKKLKIEHNEVLKLQKRLEYANERIHDVVNEKIIIEKRLNELEFKDISLQFGKFEELKKEHNQLVHRLHVTKNQLDNAREQIKSQNQFVEDSKDQIKFMELVIHDLENRGLTDFILNRFPESFNEYKKN
jgi:chromosome segregation ATPase